MTNGSHNHLAQKALETFDVHGQDKMLTFLEENQAAIEDSQHHHPGLIVLTDHSVVQPTNRGYRFYWTDHEGRDPEPRTAERETIVNWNDVPSPPVAGPARRPASDEAIAKVIQLIQDESARALEDEGFVTAAQPPAMTPKEAATICPEISRMAAQAITNEENRRRAEEAAELASTQAAELMMAEIPDAQKELLGETIRQRLAAAIAE